MPLTYEERNEPRVDEVLLNEGHAFLRKKNHHFFLYFSPRLPLSTSVFLFLFKIPREDDRVYIRR